MTKAELQQAVEAGSPLVIVEYRSTRTDFIQWRDKTTGKAMSAHLLIHVCECGAVTMNVQERMPDGWDGKQLPAMPIKRGEKCVLHFASWTVNRGAVQASGRLEKLS